MIECKTVKKREDIRKFINLPWKIYKGNNCWVPPLKRDVKRMIDPDKNAFLKKGEYEIFLFIRDKETVGRICVGIDEDLNKKKNLKRGYFTLFECIEDYSVACFMFDSAIKWLKSRGITSLRGPVSPTGGDSDEYKGLLVDSFDKPPVLLTSYNPEYYKSYIDRYGFEKDLDVYAYYINAQCAINEKTNRLINYAKKKYGFRIDRLDIKQLDREVRDIKHIMDIAMPKEWVDLVPPSVDEVHEMAQNLKKMADPDLVVIARSKDKPVGFGVAIPDYNQVLSKLNGRLTPISLIKFLIYKNKIDGARFFVMFVIPSYRKKGVSHAIYHTVIKNCMKNGYSFGEGSTIGEDNINMRRDIERLGAKRYKTYRLYKYSEKCNPK